MTKPEYDCGRDGCSIRANQERTSHYHCPYCDDPQPTSMMGHFVGGNRPDARVICNETERREYLRGIYPS